MKLKTEEQLKSVDGVTLLESPDGLPITLKSICMDVLLVPVEDDKEKDKLDKWDLFKKVRDHSEGEFTIEELNLLKKLIGKFAPQLIMGQCFEIIEKQ